VARGAGGGRPAACGSGQCGGRPHRRGESNVNLRRAPADLTIRRTLPPLVS
jgi:hypothetical protein